MVGFPPIKGDPPFQVRMASAAMAGCIADLITFPLDLAKVRLQVQGEGSLPSGNKSMLRPDTSTFKYRGMFQTITTIVKEEGPRCLYNGLTAGLQRQVCFCAVRIGLYESVRSTYFRIVLGSDDSAKHGGHILLRVTAGITTGGLAVFAAQPTDVVKVRMQAATADSGQRYKGSFHAYRTIAAAEGAKGLWRGTGPNVVRNSIVNAAELVSYDLIKQKILSLELLSDNLPCHFLAAFGGGFCTTVVASPVDVIKTRYMNSAPGVYSGAVHCAVFLFKEAGLYAFYKGFIPSFVRLASWNICMFTAFEQWKRALMHLSDATENTPPNATRPKEPIQLETT